MADADVQITAGSGTKIDTRTVGTGADEHRQVMVIGDPTTAANVASVDATYGLDVDVSRVVPGTGATNLGKAEDTAHTDGDVGVLFLGVRNHFSGSTTDGDYSAVSVSSYGDLHTVSRRDQIRIATTSAGLTTATTNYASGDTVGTLFTIANAGRITNGGGMITGITLVDAADVLVAIDVVIFDSTVTLAADNAAFAISDADALKIVSIVPLSGSIDIGSNRVGLGQNIAIPYVCNGGTSLYAALICRATMTFFTATTDLQLHTYVERY